MTTNHPDPTPPTSPAAVSAPLRPVEEAVGDVVAAHQFRSSSQSRRDGIVEHLASCSCGVEYVWRRRDAQHQEHVLAEVYMAGAARLRAAEETLAAVGALADEADALPDLRRNFDGSVSPGIVTTDKIRAALAEGASR